MDCVVAYEGPYDAVVLAGFGEHGRDGLQELVVAPVIEICEASAHVAQLVGRTYSVVTTLQRSVPLIEDRLRLAGLADRCASVRASGWATAEVDADPQGSAGAVLAQARQAVEEDHAEVICLGCAGFAGLEDTIRAELGVPVVDGVAAAVRLAEAVVGPRLDHQQALDVRVARTQADRRLAADGALTGNPAPGPAPAAGECDLASRWVGGTVVAASDESFGEKEHLLDPAPCNSQPGRYGPRGELVDGWETRRRRGGPGEDWAISPAGGAGRCHCSRRRYHVVQREPPCDLPHRGDGVRGLPRPRHPARPNGPMGDARARP